MLHYVTIVIYCNNLYYITYVSNTHESKPFYLQVFDFYWIDLYDINMIFHPSIIIRAIRIRC